MEICIIQILILLIRISAFQHESFYIFLTTWCLNLKLTPNHKTLLKAWYVMQFKVDIDQCLVLYWDFRCRDRWTNTAYVKTVRAQNIMHSCTQVTFFPGDFSLHIWISKVNLCLCLLSYIFQPPKHVMNTLQIIKTFNTAENARCQVHMAHLLDNVALLHNIFLASKISWFPKFHKFIQI